MSNLPRFGRAWQRFSSLPRPGTAPQTETQPLTTRTEPEVYTPATTNVLQTSPIRERSSRIPSPVKRIPSPPSSPKYSGATTISPRKPRSPTPTNRLYDGERRISATTSPKTFVPTYDGITRLHDGVRPLSPIKPAKLKPTDVSPPLSPPKPKQYSTVSTDTTAAPLSPLKLPRSEARHETEHTIRSRSPPEVEQKKMLYQTRTTEKSTKTDHRQQEYGSGKPTQQKQHHQQSDVINIKGENVGAVMHITHSSDGSEIVNKKPSVWQSKENEEKTNKATSSIPGKSFMNSNFQGVNNSILYNSSLSHRDPGVHLVYSKKPNQGDSLHESRH